MHKKQSKTYQDLLVAVNSSKSEKSLQRLLDAERLAREVLVNRDDLAVKRSFKTYVARLVRWLDDSFSQTTAELLIMAYVRGTMTDLSGKHVKDRVDLMCPVCGAPFTVDDIRSKRKISLDCYMSGANFVARYRCARCESAWQDVYSTDDKILKLVGTPTQRVVYDGRF